MNSTGWLTRGRDLEKRAIIGKLLGWGVNAGSKAIGAGGRAMTASAGSTGGGLMNLARGAGSMAKGVGQLARSPLAIGTGVGTAGIAGIKQGLGYYDPTNTQGNLGWHRQRMLGYDEDGTHSYLRGLGTTLTNPFQSAAAMMFRGGDTKTEMTAGGTPLATLKGPGGQLMQVSKPGITSYSPRESYDRAQFQGMLGRAGHRPPEAKSLFGTNLPAGWSVAGGGGFGDDILDNFWEAQGRGGRGAGQPQRPAGYDPRFPPGAYGYIPGVNSPLRDI